MKLQTIILLVVTVTIIQAHEPKVHEIVDDQITNETNENLRIIRDGENSQRRPKFYQPPIFDYKSTRQQDPRQYRYALQQVSDMKNLLGRSGDVDWTKIDQITVNLDERPKTRSSRSRKLPPNKYNELQATDRLDTVVPIDTTVNGDLSMLNQLIGLPPNTQLEGLRKLLASPKTRVLLPVVNGPRPFQMKDHTPIFEHIIDIPNPQSRPNIKVDKNPLHSNLNLQNIQAQLDAAAKEEADKILAEANRQALAEVEAQHKAIVSARIAAEQKALAKIADYNQDHQPIALALNSGNNGKVYAPDHNHKQNVVNVEVVTIRPSQIEKEFQPIGGDFGVNDGVKTLLPKENLHPRKPQTDHDHNHQYAARYAFGYRIKDVQMGNDFGHEEKREGKSAKGHYHVLLPDGRLQKVDYYADPTGYHARVTYENVAYH